MNTVADLLIERLQVSHGFGLNGFLLKRWVRSLALAGAVAAVALLIAIFAFYYYNISEQWVTPTAVLIAIVAGVVFVALLYQGFVGAQRKK